MRTVWPVNSKDLESRAHAQLAVFFDGASKQRGYDFIMPSLVFSQRGKIAGSAALVKNQIRLNSVLYSDNIDVFLAEVIPHELAHLLVFQQYGRVKPHGVEWQKMMIEVFALEPRVRHSMDVSKVQGRVFSYNCSCGPVHLSIRRHNKVKSGKQQYLCAKCRQTLKPLLREHAV